MIQEDVKASLHTVTTETRIFCKCFVIGNPWLHGHLNYFLEFILLAKLFSVLIPIK